MIADILAFDADGNPVLVVGVKGRPLEASVAEQVLAYIESHGPPIPYGMVVDPRKIRVLRHDCDNPTGFACTLETKDVLRHYDPEVGEKQIFAYYLTSLVEAWLRDLAYRWKSETPPGADSLAEIGLMQRLEGGSTRSEAHLDVDALR